MTWAGRKARILHLLEESPTDSLLRNELVEATGWPEMEVHDLIRELMILGQVRLEPTLYVVGGSPGHCRVHLLSNEHRAHERANTT